MSRVSWDRRLRAIEQRPTAQRPLKIVGGLPTGAEMLQSLAQAKAPQPLCPTLAEAEHAAEPRGANAPPAPTDSMKTDQTV
jgi:hypothetical protein